MVIEPVEFDLRATDEDYARGFDLMYLRRRKPRAVVILLLLPVLAYGCFWLLGAENIGLIVAAVLALWCFFLLSGYGRRFFCRRLARRVRATTPSIRADWRVRVSTEGVGATLPDGVAQIPWRLFLGYSRDEGGMIVYDAPTVIRIFPARLLSAAELDRIEAFAQQAGVTRI